MSDNNKTAESKDVNTETAKKPLYENYGDFEDQYLPDYTLPSSDDHFESEPIYADRNESLLSTMNEPLQETEPVIAASPEINSDDESQLNQEEHKDEGNINTYTSDNVAVQYQHYLLLLDTLREERHEQEYTDFISSVMADQKILDDFDASPEALSKIDIELAHCHIDKIKKHCPKTFAAVSSSIFKDDSSHDLIEAGIDVTGSESNVPLSFPYDVAIIKAYESKFPDTNRKPLKERLVNFKGVISGAANNESGKALIATTIFALATGASGVGLPIATCIFATKMLENKKVQDLMTSLEDKTSKALIKMGFKKESVNERKKPLGERMKDISETKWFKASKVPLVACSIALGFGALAITQFDIGVADLKAAADVVMSLPAPTVESVSAILGGAYEGVSSAMGGAADSIGSSAESLKNAGIEAYQSAVNYTSSAIESGAAVLDKTSMALKESANIASAATGDIGNAFDKAFATPEINEGGFEMASASDTTDVKNNATEVSSETTTAPAADAAPKVTTYSAKAGFYPWNMAEQHYVDMTGEKPTAQQITAMVNDLGLEDPNKTFEGQKIEFSNDVSKYTEVKSVTADWLGNGSANATETGALASNKGAIGTSVPISPEDQVAAMQKFAEKQRDYSGINL